MSHAGVSTTSQGKSHRNSTASAGSKLRSRSEHQSRSKGVVPSRSKTIDGRERSHSKTHSIRGSTHADKNVSYKDINEADRPQECVCGPNLFGNLLGPTVDEQILAGLSALFKMCDECPPETLQISDMEAEQSQSSVYVEELASMKSIPEPLPEPSIAKEKSVHASQMSADRSSLATKGSVSTASETDSKDTQESSVSTEISEHSGSQTQQPEHKSSELQTEAREVVTHVESLSGSSEASQTFSQQSCPCQPSQHTCECGVSVLCQPPAIVCGPGPPHEASHHSQHYELPHSSIHKSSQHTQQQGSVHHSQHSTSPDPSRHKTSRHVGDDESVHHSHYDARSQSSHNKASQHQLSHHSRELAGSLSHHKSSHISPQHYSKQKGSQLQLSHHSRDKSVHHTPQDRDSSSTSISTNTEAKFPTKQCCCGQSEKETETSSETRESSTSSTCIPCCPGPKSALKTKSSKKCSCKFVDETTKSSCACLSVNKAKCKQNTMMKLVTSCKCNKNNMIISKTNGANKKITICGCGTSTTTTTTSGDISTEAEEQGEMGDFQHSEIRYAITKITKFSSYTTFEVMKSTKKKPKVIPSKLEGVFVLRNKKCCSV